jgi:hypothetical protein
LAGAGAAAQKLKDFNPSEFYCGSSLGATASTLAAQAAHDSSLSDEVDLKMGTLTSTELAAGNWVQVTCGEENFRTFLDIKVMVATTTPTTFAKILSTNTLTTEVEATARVYPKETAAYGNAIVSLSDNCSVGGLSFGGNSTVKVNKGGIFSNSCIYAGGSTDVEVTGGAVSYFTTYSGSCNDGHMSPCPVKVTKKLPTISIPTPKCTTAAYVNAPSSGTMNPGNYNGLTGGGGTLTLNPGLYCLKGDFDGKGIIIGHGVTLYFITGGVKLNGNAEIHLEAPNCENTSCGVPPAIRGVLMYFADTNAADVTLNGSSENEFMGTIYGKLANFKINGSSATDTINAQIIGNKVSFIGSGSMFMNLEGAELFQYPSSIELLK